MTAAIPNQRYPALIERRYSKNALLPDTAAGSPARTDRVLRRILHVTSVAATSRPTRYASRRLFLVRKRRDHASRRLFLVRKRRDHASRRLFPVRRRRDHARKRLFLVRRCRDHASRRLFPVRRRRDHTRRRLFLV